MSAPETSAIARAIYTFHSERCLGYALAVAAPLVSFSFGFALEEITGPVARLIYYGIFFLTIIASALLAGGRAGLVSLVLINLLIGFFILPRFPAVRPPSIVAIDVIWLGVIWLCNHTHTLILALKRQQIELQIKDRHHTLMVQELNHRVKNTLAQIQAISRMTRKNSLTLEQFDASFSDRLMALSKTHNLLTDASWDGVSLRQLLAAELDIAELLNRVNVRGEDVHLSAKVSLALGLAIHELLTNATKYGALSCDDGHLDIHWTIERDGGLLRLHWVEACSHRIEKPTHLGFGSKLIRMSIDMELGGNVEKEFTPNGLKALIEVPLRTYANANDMVPEQKIAAE